MAQIKNTIIDDTGFLQLPSGTTAQRPSSAESGQIRFNTDTDLVEWYDDEYSAWFPADFVLPVASGGTVTDITQGGVDYRVHTFTAVGTSTFTVTRGGSVEFLIVAGGGGGGPIGGGGGAGGLLTGFTTVTPQSYTITVGNGGNSGTSGTQATNGGNSSAFNFTSIGGGAGGNHVGSSDSNPGLTGGSGGGGGDNGGPGQAGFPQGSGTPGQGNSGGQGVPGNSNSLPRLGGGGGGAGQPGFDYNQQTGKGGDGVFSNIDGNGYFYAAGGGAGGYQNDNVTPDKVGDGGLGGGGGGSANTGTAGSGGQGGRNPGGNGSIGSNLRGGNGGANTGSGGGGCSWSTPTIAVQGGSGIVIIRYRIS